MRFVMKSLYKSLFWIIYYKVSSLKRAPHIYLVRPLISFLFHSTDIVKNSWV